MKIIDTKTLFDCQEVLNKHQKKKGDSYKTCSIEYLQQKVIEEYNEYIMAGRTTEYKELLDLINVSIMLAERLKNRC